MWQWILPSVGYVFNRPHAGSYAAAQAYQDGWLKFHYPLFSYAACLTLDEKKAMSYLREARDPLFNLSVLPPDVNVSDAGFTPDVEANAIRFGLGGIKGIGAAVAAQVLADRPFTDVEDFVTRSSRKYSKVNKKAREILWNVGALDRFGARKDWTPKERAEQELELLGVALEPSGTLGEDAVLVHEHVNTEQEVAASPPDAEVVVAGKVVELKRTRVKKAGRYEGRAMATGIKVVLDLDHYRCVAFPDVWDQYESLLTGDEMIILRGKLDDRGTIKIEMIMPLAQFIGERRQAVAA
jgi:DNA polymerase III alpha subunit